MDLEEYLLGKILNHVRPADQAAQQARDGLFPAAHEVFERAGITLLPAADQVRIVRAHASSFALPDIKRLAPRNRRRWRKLFQTLGILGNELPRSPGERGGGDVARIIHADGWEGCAKGCEALAPQGFQDCRRAMDRNSQMLAYSAPKPESAGTKSERTKRRCKIKDRRLLR